MQSYFIKSLATWIKVIEGRCPPNESPFLVRTPCPRFKTLPTKRNLALQHVIFMNFVCWKIHGPWQWDSPWQVRSLNPAPLVQDLMAPNWRDPCLWCAYFVMVLATSSLLTSCGYISFHHLHYTSWYFMAPFGGTPMTTWITDYWGTLTDLQ